MSKPRLTLADALAKVPKGEPRTPAVYVPGERSYVEPPPPASKAPPLEHVLGQQRLILDYAFGRSTPDGLVKLNTRDLRNLGTGIARPEDIVRAMCRRGILRKTGNVAPGIIGWSEHEIAAALMDALNKHSLASQGPPRGNPWQPPGNPLATPGAAPGFPRGLPPDAPGRARGIPDPDLGSPEPDLRSLLSSSSSSIPPAWALACEEEEGRRLFASLRAECGEDAVLLAELATLPTSVDTERITDHKGARINAWSVYFAKPGAFVAAVRRVRALEAKAQRAQAVRVAREQEDHAEDHERAHRLREAFAQAHPDPDAYRAAYDFWLARTGLKGESPFAARAAFELWAVAKPPVIEDPE